MIFIKYRRLTSTGDYSFGRNKGDFLTDIDAVTQAIYTTLKLLKGEWWEDLEAGLPLFQSIIGQSGTPEHIKAIDLIVNDKIMNVAGVINITNYNGIYTNRMYSITCTVDTLYGQVAVEVTL